MHSNSAFGLARSVPWARYLATQGDSRLLTAITKAAIQWYGADRDYPAHYEPSGTDFLSPALTEIDLMSLVLEREEFFTWLDAFLPGLSSGEPKALFEPAFVSDAGSAAHAKASMGAVTGSDYMVEHWLACYAMLYLSGG
jgi:hypothetical protein